MLSSFDAYYGPFERGGASTGQRLQHCRRRYAAPCGRKYGATSPTGAALSRRKRSIGSPVREGSRLSNPLVMAFDRCKSITRSNLDALVAYLRTLKPVKP